MCEQMQVKGICILMRHPSHIMQRPPAGYNKGTGIRITLVCRHMLEEGSIKPDTLVYPFYVNPPSLNRSGQMRSHHAGMYNLFTCTWSCSCFRYSMASSSMDALSVCTSKIHHGTNTFKFISSTNTTQEPSIHGERERGTALLVFH